MGSNKDVKAGERQPKKSHKGRGPRKNRKRRSARRTPKQAMATSGGRVMKLKGRRNRAAEQEGSDE